MYAAMQRVVGAAIFLFVTSFVAVAQPAVTEARFGDHGTKTRFVLEMADPVSYEIFTLDDPYRVVIDLPELDWRLPSRVDTAGVVSGFRYGLFKPGQSRVVLDTRRPVRVEKAFVIPPRDGHAVRLVIDLAAVSREAFLRGQAAQPPPPEPAPTPAIPIVPPRRPDEKPLIAIDAGHGGVDPGTIGVTGVEEKEVTLAHARALREALLATGGYRVKLTRDRDIFIRLRERIEIARLAGADMFISLHADSIDDPQFRGSSVYTLSERASDAEAAALAAKENKADLIGGIDLNGQPSEVANILIELAQRETMNESAIFARMLVGELSQTVRLVRNTHRFAGFAVLKAPDVPSILVELGYLSNRQDEALLRSPDHQRKMSRAIVEAIDAYFARHQAFKSP